MLSCLNTQRWKRLNSVNASGHEGAPEERAGERAEWSRVGHRSHNTRDKHTLFSEESGQRSMKREEEEMNPDTRYRTKISSFLVPSYLPSSPLTPAHHPPALCAPPQKSSDSWKVLGVYSVTTKQNHLKTKWAGECAGAIRPLSLCGRREKRPLRIKGMEGGRAGGGTPFQSAGYPPTPLPSTHPDPLLLPPLHPTHTPTLLSAPFKGEHAI